MTTARTKRKRNSFALIDIAPLRDESLSWEARGVLAFLMTKADDCRISEDDLINESKNDEPEVLRSAIQELKDAGYLDTSAAEDLTND